MSHQRSPRRSLLGGAFVFSACLLFACGGSSGGSQSNPAAPTPNPAAPTPIPSGPLVFTHAPIPPSELQYIIALGQMRPWGHTLPTDHVYFYHHFNVGSFPPVTITAPASGTVEAVLDRGADAKITVRVNSGFIYMIDHINLKPGFVSGAPVQGGTEMGTSTSGVFDLGVSNLGRPLPFVNLARYSRETLFADSPLRFFEEPLRSQFYAKVQRTGGDLDGRIDYDAAGTLSGNWFEEDLPPERSGLGGDMFVGTRQLSFARDAQFADRRCVAIGGLGFTGLWYVSPDAPDFTAITTASGLVIYKLFGLMEINGGPGIQQQGLLLVELLDAQRLRIEAVPGQFSTASAFGANARIYLR